MQLKRRVYVLGGHPLNGHSMVRYTSLLADAYASSGFLVHVLRPTAMVSRMLAPSALRKFVIYIEKLFIFPLKLCWIPRAAYVHIADHSDGIWLLCPWLGGRQVTVTCHDLFAIQAANGAIPEHMPRLSGRIYQYLIDQGLRKCTRFIAVSRTTKRDVVERYPKIPVSVVSNPVAAAFMDGQKDIGRYALIVGTVGWRKRREVALDIWLRMRKGKSSLLPLVIIGPDLTSLEKQMLSEAQVAPDQVKVMSDVDENLLVKVYAGAKYLILASKYEGFAWPIVEANAVGVPALCADTAILRETGAGNVFFAEPLDDNDWQDVLTHLYSLRHSQGLITKAQGFSQEKFRTDLCAVLVLEGGSGSCTNFKHA